MDDSLLDYATYYRWFWFNRPQWQKTFRQRKRASSGGFIKIVKERGLDKEVVLDSSCGLGLKTIVIKEAGINVEGSDGCAEAIEYARILAREEGHEGIVYFRSTWEELLRLTDQRYASAFSDALTWLYKEKEMSASLKGFHDVLRPGGILVYMGALPGSNGDPELLLEGEWDKMLLEQGKRSLGFRCSDDNLNVQESIVLEKGTDYIDKHHVFAIEDKAGRRRVEKTTIRQTCKWQWPTMEKYLTSCGFSKFAGEEFAADDEKKFPLVVAERD